MSIKLLSVLPRFQQDPAGGAARQSRDIYAGAKALLMPSLCQEPFGCVEHTPRSLPSEVVAPWVSLIERLEDDALAPLYVDWLLKVVA